MENFFSNLVCNLNTVEIHLDGADIDERYVETYGISDVGRVRVAESNYGRITQKEYIRKKTKKDFQNEKQRARRRKKKEARVGYKPRRIQGNGKHFDSQIQVHVDSMIPGEILKIKCFRKGTLNLPGGKRPDMQDIQRPLLDIIKFLEMHSFFIPAHELFKILKVPESDRIKLFECGTFILNRINKMVRPNVLAVMRRKNEKEGGRLSLEYARKMCKGVDLSIEGLMNSRIWKTEIRHYICREGGIYPTKNWEKLLEKRIYPSKISVVRMYSVLLNFNCSVIKVKESRLMSLNLPRLVQMFEDYMKFTGPRWRRGLCAEFEALGTGREFSNTLRKFLPDNPIGLVQIILDTSKSRVKISLKFYRGKLNKPWLEGDVAVKIFSSGTINIDSTQEERRALAVFVWLRKMIYNRRKNVIQHNTLW